MYSHRSDHSRQYNERRHWDADEERREKHDTHRNSHRKYGGSTERTSRSREYSESPRRQYSKDSMSRERRRQSPLRRRVPSPDWGASEKKRRRVTEDDYRRLPERKMSRPLSLDSANVHPSGNFKHEEDFESRKGTKSSRHEHRHEEFDYRKRREDIVSSQLSGCHNDRDDRERAWDCSRERTRSHDDSVKNQERDVSHHTAKPPDENKSSKGFQLFLDVLNKGVNVATLTKIMTSAKEDHRPRAPTSHLNSEDQASSPEFGQNTNHRSEEVDFWRLTPSENPHKSLSTPNKDSFSGERPLQPCDGHQSYPSSSGGSGSLTHSDKITLTPEEQHKHKQAQHILQAIGMNIEFEELGQMTHRIQERLYGKKDDDRVRPGRRSRERDATRAVSPKLHHRSSSSSRSSCSQSPQKSKTRDSHTFQRTVAEEPHQIQVVSQSIDYGQNSSSNLLQGSTNNEAKSRENIFPCQSYSQNLAYATPEPRPVPMMPTYSPASSPGLPYPPLLPNLPQPNPQVCFPPVPLYPHPPPVNVFPAVLAQMRPLFPPPVGNPPVQPLNPPQKAKPPSRPRCLQVIETKQPG